MWSLAGYVRTIVNQICCWLGAVLRLSSELDELSQYLCYNNSTNNIVLIISSSISSHRYCLSGVVTTIRYTTYALLVLVTLTFDLKVKIATQKPLH